jgi:hypothetical protein
MASTDSNGAAALPSLTESLDACLADIPEADARRSSPAACAP